MLTASKASIAFGQFNATPGSRGAALCVGNDLSSVRGCLWDTKTLREFNTNRNQTLSLKKSPRVVDRLGHHLSAV